MKWYEKNHDVNGTPVTIEGTFTDSTIKIIAIIEIDSSDPANGFRYKELYNKPVNMWFHQEVIAEDILAKYQGKIIKLENNLHTLVEREKLDKRI